MYILNLNNISWSIRNLIPKDKQSHVSIPFLEKIAEDSNFFEYKTLLNKHKFDHNIMKKYGRRAYNNGKLNEDISTFMGHVLSDFLQSPQHYDSLDDSLILTRKQLTTTFCVFTNRVAIQEYKFLTAPFFQPWEADYLFVGKNFTQKCQDVKMESIKNLTEEVKDYLKSKNYKLYEYAYTKLDLRK